MNVRYPEEAQKAKVEGIVVASFIVEVDGSLNDIRIIKGLGMGTDEEIIRVVESMNGKWLPGKQDGKTVPVQYTLPVRFTIK
ncbi:energy transducer TonB [Pontibacter pamirensis]|uniref:energy transducer TonB n=1 Tax=Pontibacter pamirensis TaxID=2562824 RepID=UPI0021CF4926|nr:energy transducer TonB [Pontibacter pamirensis]